MEFVLPLFFIFIMFPASALISLFNFYRIRKNNKPIIINGVLLIVLGGVFLLIFHLSSIFIIGSLFDNVFNSTSMQIISFIILPYILMYFTEIALLEFLSKRAG